MPVAILKKLTQNMFLLLSCCFLIIGLSYFLLGYDRIEMNLYFYCRRTALLDMFFKYATQLAELTVTIFFILLLFYYKNSYVVFYLLLILIVTLVVYFLKHEVFGYIRPSLYLQGHLEITPIAGTSLLKNYSFPSGHTTFIFATMTYFSLLIKNKYIQACFFLMALSCAISRVYLFQHFYIDIYVGSILGIAISLLLFYLTKESILNNKQSFLSFSIKNYYTKK